MADDLEPRHMSRSYMDRIEDFLKERFLDNPELTGCLIDLHRRYAEWDLKDSKFDQDFTDGTDEHFFSYLWEMLLASHFKNSDLDISSADEGPDFKIDHSGTMIWVEAICPAPTGLPDDWLRETRAGEVRVRNLPYEEMLLRWTSAMKDKKEKLIRWEGRKGIVGPNDPYVIAVSACRLGQHETHLHNSISQLPFAVEAVFPVGPIEVRIDAETMETVDTRHGLRWFIRKPNSAEVPTDSFLNPDYTGISALLGSPAGLNAACGYQSPMAVVHNPLAKNPLPIGILKPDEEYVAENKGDHYELRDINEATDQNPAM